MQSRALLLATLLLAPALAAAQTVAQGAVTFQNGRDFPMYINATECGGGTVTAAWNPTLTNGATGIPTAGGFYVIYGSNQAPRVVNNVQSCWTENDVTSLNPGLSAAQVLNTQNTNTPLGLTASINTQTLTAAAGKSCANDGATIYICVQGYVGSVASANIFGIASSSVIISTTIPPPPTITSITPGNGALNVSWEPGSSTSTFTGDSYSFQLSADFVATTSPLITDPVQHHTSSMFTANSARFDGLVNTVTYAVTARAFSKAGNPSDPSAAENGTPQHVNDFWDTYKAEGGRDDGGCAGGPAGPLALALVAGALALTRRRK
jgi:hypothetical protein